MQNWNLRHIYKLGFLIFWAVFLRILLRSFQKMLIWPQKNFWAKNKKRYQKRRILRWFRICWKSCKCTQKKLQAKLVWRTWVKVKKVHISVTFLLITFFWFIFSKFFQRIRNQREILRFLIPILNFLIKICLALISTFCTLWLQMRRKWLKKMEIFFYECVLEFY